MYFKSSVRKNPKTQNLCPYFRLVESYRDLNNRICHRTILNIGFLEDFEPDQLSIVQQALTERSAGKVDPLPQADEAVLSLIELLWLKIISQKRIDLRGPKALPKKTKALKLEVIQDKQVRELGKEWLCYQCLKQLDLLTFLQSLGWGEEQIQLTFTQIICRASYPASELKRSKIIQQISAVCEITGYPVSKISKDILYKNAQAIYKEKDFLEAYLSKKTNELFNIKDETVLYNITNIYFEAGNSNSDNTQPKISRNKHIEGKLIILAMIITPEGFLKYSHLFNGNTADSDTIPKVANDLRSRTVTQGKRALLVIDASIATAENLRLLEDNGYDYICVSRSKLKNYQTINGVQPVEVLNQYGEQLTLQQVIGEKSMDYYLKGKSLSEGAKLMGIRNLFETRFVEELQKINQGILKKHGVKTLDKIQQRIDKVLQKYPTASRYFNIKVANDGKNLATEITWEKKEKFRLNKKELGVYFIRTSLPVADEHLLWNCYNTIREMETSFRTIETNLDLYPVYHENDNFTLAHLHVDLLAHWIVNAVRYQLKSKNINHSWQEIMSIASSQKLVITSAKNQSDETVITKRSSEPAIQLNKILNALNYKHFPFTKRRVVVKPSKSKKKLPQVEPVSPSD